MIIFSDVYVIPVTQGCTNFLGQGAKFANGQCVESHKSACTLLSNKNNTNNDIICCIVLFCQ